MWSVEATEWMTLVFNDREGHSRFHVNVLYFFHLQVAQLQAELHVSKIKYTSLLRETEKTRDGKEAEVEKVPPPFSLICLILFTLHAQFLLS